MQEKDAIIEILDEQGKVISSKTRAQIDKRKDVLKSVHIIVMNDKHQLFLARSANDTLYPTKWGSSAAGLVRQGESFSDAAKRTLKRELDITPKLDEVEIGFHDFDGVKRLMGIFLANTRAKPTLNPVDASEGSWMTLEEAEKLMNTGECTPMMKKILKAVRE